MEIKPGAVVILRSGGPLMTVESVDCERAACVWFAQDDEPVEGFFPVTSLLVVPEPLVVALTGR